jgi:hypothetical protein
MAFTNPIFTKPIITQEIFVSISHTEVYPKWMKNVDHTVKNSFMHQSKLWRSLHQFSQNQQESNKA